MKIVALCNPIDFRFYGTGVGIDKNVKQSNNSLKKIRSKVFFASYFR